MALPFVMEDLPPDATLCKNSSISQVKKLLLTGDVHTAEGMVNEPDM